MDRRKRERSAVTHIPPRLSADAVLRKSMPPARLTTTEKFVVVGASTGGSEALPMDAPGVIVVQHMPEGFTAQFARRLDRQCQVRVSAAATYAGKNAVGVIMTGMGDDGARGMLCSDVRHAHTPKLIVRRRQRQTPRRCCV